MPILHKVKPCSQRGGKERERSMRGFGMRRMAEIHRAKLAGFRALTSVVVAVERSFVWDCGM